MSKATESMFDGKNVLIPLEEVSYVLKFQNCIEVRFKDSADSLTLAQPDKNAFISAWCRYRGEVEADTLMDLDGAQPAPSEGSITAGILSGMFLSLDGHDKAQPGYEWRKGWNDAIRQAMDYAQPAPSIPEGWLRAIDEALVVAHIGVANESDTFEQAREKLDNLIGFHVDVASDPAVNGGWKLVPIEPMPSMPKLHVGYLPTINQDGYPALGAWWVQLWDGDDVFARVYGSSPEEAHNRAEMLAAAPEAKP